MRAEVGGEGREPLVVDGKRSEQPVGEPGHVGSAALNLPPRSTQSNGSTGCSSSLNPSSLPFIICCLLNVRYIPKKDHKLQEQKLLTPHSPPVSGKVGGLLLQASATLCLRPFVAAGVCMVATPAGQKC